MNKLQRKSGQGMTEYIIIIAIIAIGAILIVGLFGRQIKEVFTGMGGALAGENDKSDKVDMEKAGQIKDTMGSFDEQDQ